MKAFFDQYGWEGIIGLFVAFNATLVAVSSVLDKVKDWTSSDVDNKASAILHKVIDFINLVIDVVTGNKAHK